MNNPSVILLVAIAALLVGIAAVLLVVQLATSVL
jgi:hypothetical protein